MTADVRSTIYEIFSVSTWEPCIGSSVSAVCANSTSGLDVLDELGRVVYVLLSRIARLSKVDATRMNHFQSYSRFLYFSFIIFYPCNSDIAVLSFRRRTKLLSISAFCFSLVQSTRFFTLSVFFTRRARSPRFTTKPRKNKSLRTGGRSGSVMVLSRVLDVPEPQSIYL
jgi:hypothetical protein